MNKQKVCVVYQSSTIYIAPHFFAITVTLTLMNVCSQVSNILLISISNRYPKIVNRLENFEIRIYNLEYLLFARLNTRYSVDKKHKFALCPVYIQ